MKTESNIAAKLITIILLAGFIIAIFTIMRRPVTGDDLSVYASLIPQTIGLLVLPIIGGIGFVIYGLFKNNHYWQLGLFLILLSSLVIVLLPYLKGYQFSDGGDHLTHLGFTRDILNTGHFGGNNIYPVTHILIAQISLISDVPAEIVINFIGPLFYLLFVFFTYLCAKEIISRSAAILATVASTVLFAYYYNEVFPMGYALIFFPLIFFLYFRHQKTKSARYSILLITLVFLMVFFHPITSFLLTLSLLLMEFGTFIYNRFFTGRRDSSPFASSIPMISFYSLVLWIWYRYYVWNSAVSSVAGWFNAELFVQPMTAIARDSLNKLGLNSQQQLILIVSTYGHILLFLGLSIIAVLWMVKNKVFSRVEFDREIFIYSCLFFPAVAIWLFDYVRPLTDLSSGRMVWIIVTILPLLTGFALNKFGGIDITGNVLIKNRYWAITRATFIGLLIATSSVIGIISIYPSPYVYQPFEGITNASFTGESWIVQEGNPKMNVLGLYTPPTSRIANALWGTGKEDYPKTDPAPIDFHFGYDVHPTYGQSFPADKYLFLIETNKLLYTELWPQVGRLNSGDFTKLENDPTVGCIYDNGKAQNYYITAVNSVHNQ